MQIVPRDGKLHPIISRFCENPAKRKKGVKSLKPSGKTASSRKGKGTSKRKVPVRSDGSLSKDDAAGVLSGLFS